MTSEPLTPEALDTIEAARSREITALRRVWQAMGCELDPDDFKPAVRDRIWDMIVAQAEADTQKNNRLYRENESLEVELRRLRTENEEQRNRNSGFRELAEAAGNRRTQLHDSVVEALSRGIDHMPECYAWSDMNQSECTCGVSILRAALTGEATEQKEALEPTTCVSCRHNIFRIDEGWIHSYPGLDEKHAASPSHAPLTGGAGE
jgi:hypothetical protein